MQFTRKKIVLIATSSVAALTLSGVAIAYWTSGGTDDGTDTTGASSTVTVTAADLTDALSPGDTSALSGTISASKPTKVTSITATVTGTSDPLCLPANFQITQQPTLATTNITSVDSTWDGGVLTFLNAATNQDVCKGVTINIHYVAA